MKIKTFWLFIVPAVLLGSCKRKNEPEQTPEPDQPVIASYRLDSTLYYSSNVLQSKDIYSYRADGHQDHKLRYEYNSDSHQWSANSKTEYSAWNAAGEYGQYVEYIPAESGWAPSVKYTRNFNSSGNVSAESYELWSGGEWQNNLKYQYTHTSKGDVELRESWYFYNGVTYYSVIKNQYFYRENIIDSLYSSSRSNEKDAFLLDSKTVYPTYDKNGNRTEEITYSLANNKWTPATRLQVSYDSKNNLLGGTSYTWRNNNWAITGESTISYKYLEDTDLISEYSERNTYYDESGSKSASSSLTMKHFYTKH